jgi:hypothetical protein
MITSIRENIAFFSVSAAVLLLLFYAVYHSSIASTCFDIDEADYMCAVEKGFSANYFDKNTIPFSSFINLGFSYGMKTDKQTYLSKTIRSVDDITVFRCLHGPLYFYYLILGKKLAGIDERNIRAFSHLLQYFCAVIVVLGFLFVSNFSRSARIPALAASLLILLSPSMYLRPVNIRTAEASACRSIGAGRE